jgi:hypothetical protein
MNTWTAPCPPSFGMPIAAVSPCNARAGEREPGVADVIICCVSSMVLARRSKHDPVPSRTRLLQGEPARRL